MYSLDDGLPVPVRSGYRTMYRTYFSSC